MNKKLSLLALGILIISLFGYKEHCRYYDTLCFNYPYGFYMLLKFIVCSYFVYQTIVLFQKERNSFKLILCAILAFLYNPIIAIPFEKEIWYAINIITIVYIEYMSKSFRNILKNFHKKKLSKKYITADELMSIVPGQLLSVPLEIRQQLMMGGPVLLSLDKNLECVPISVLEMQYTKDAIQAYVWYYTQIYYSKLNLPEQYRNLFFSMILLTLFTYKSYNITSFDMGLMRDPRFTFFPKMINMFINEKIENQTALLVCIEHHMEELTGKRVRFREERKSQKDSIEKKDKNTKLKSKKSNLALVLQDTPHQ